MEAEAAAPVAAWAAERLYWVFIGLMILNMLQRKHHERAPKKRLATLYLGLGMFFLFLVAHSINHFGGRDLFFYLGIAAFVAVVFAYRTVVFPFRFKSRVDGRWLRFDEIFFDDAHGEGETIREESISGDDSEEDDSEDEDIEHRP